MAKPQENDDQLLSAYIDGELPAEESALLVDRLATEPALVRRLEAMRSGDANVRAVYEALDQVPLPAGVTKLLDMQEESGQADNVVSLAPRVQRRSFFVPAAIAASVALVAVLLVGRQLSVDPQATGVDMLLAGQLDQDSAIHEILESRTSGEPYNLDDTAQMQIIMSFEAENGDYCRQLYVASPSQSAHALACRGATSWEVEAVAPGAPVSPGGQFQQAAGSTPVAVAAAVDALIGSRDPLGKDEENALISDTWKNISD